MRMRRASHSKSRPTCRHWEEVRGVLIFRKCVNPICANARSGSVIGTAFDDEAERHGFSEKLRSSELILPYSTSR